MQNLPDSNIPDVRDYLYVDRDRVGSLLTQLSDGLPEERNEGNRRSTRLSVGLRRIAEFGREIDESGGRTLALADLHVSELEEAAEALGMLEDISDKMLKRKFWLRGNVRKQVSPGMILRVTAPTQISDLASISSSLRQLNNTISSGEKKEGMAKVLNAFEALYGNSITIAIRTAADDEEFEVGFVGEIPHNHEYGPMRRDLLLSQLGPSESTLTTLMQVSAIPTERDSSEPIETLIANAQGTLRKIQEKNGINRSALDQMVSVFGSMLATAGFVAAPRWPAIGVIPLAIYRSVDPVSGLSTQE